MRSLPIPDPAPVPDDEIANATGHPWWSPLTDRLLAEIDPEPQPDDDPPAPTPGR